MTHNILIIFLKLIVLTFFCVVANCEYIDGNSSLEFGNRILNGKRADDYQFTYQVSLQKYGKHNCGGSIISEVKVLTAAHCVTNINGDLLPKEKFRILAGTNYLNTNNAKNYYSVKHISIHPKYNQKTVQYDYAIVFTKRKFDFNCTHISMIPLAIKNPSPGEVCYLSGWGDIDTSTVIRAPNELQYAQIMIDESQKCETIFGDIFLSAQMLCVGQRNKENAGCGDSGGPLVCNNYLCGVVSYGMQDYNPKFPDVYGSVFHVSEWITQTNGSSRLKVERVVSAIVFFVSFVMQVIWIN